MLLLLFDPLMRIKTSVLYFRPLLLSLLLSYQANLLRLTPPRTRDRSKACVTVTVYGIRNTPPVFSQEKKEETKKTLPADPVTVIVSFLPFLSRQKSCRRKILPLPSFPSSPLSMPFAATEGKKKSLGRERID